MWAAAKQTEKVQTGAHAEGDPRLRDGSHLRDRVTPDHLPSPLLSRCFGQLGCYLAPEYTEVRRTELVDGGDAVLCCLASFG